MESAPTICKAITIKKKIEFTSKQGLRTRNVWLAKRFDEKNTSKDSIVKYGVPANPDLWGEGATTLKASNDVTTSLRTILR